MSDIDKKYDVDACIKETLDRMERQLMKYRIDQSTPTSGRYGSVSSPDSGLATRPLDYTFDNEGDSTLTSDRNQLRVDKEQVVYQVVIAISAPQELHHHLAEQG